MQSIMSLDTYYSSTHPGALSRPLETAPIVLEDDEPLRIHVFIDTRIVGKFVNGQKCIAARVYPGRDVSVGVSLRAQGSAAVLESLDAWQMSDIYELACECTIWETGSDGMVDAHALRACGFGLAGSNLASTTRGYR